MLIQKAGAVSAPRPLFGCKILDAASSTSLTRPISPSPRRLHDVHQNHHSRIAPIRCVARLGFGAVRETPVSANDRCKEWELLRKCGPIL
jgi:hypothetical protein